MNVQPIGLYSVIPTFLKNPHDLLFFLFQLFGQLQCFLFQFQKTGMHLVELIVLFEDACGARFLVCVAIHVCAHGRYEAFGHHGLDVLVFDFFLYQNPQELVQFLRLCRDGTLR